MSLGVSFAVSMMTGTSLVSLIFWSTPHPSSSGNPISRMTRSTLWLPNSTSASGPFSAVRISRSLDSRTRLSRFRISLSSSTTRILMPLLPQPTCRPCF